MNPPADSSQIAADESSGFSASRLLLHVALIVGGLLMIFPFVWMVLTAFKDMKQTLAVPPVFLPHPWVWENIPQALTALPFGRAYANSLIVGVLVVVITLLTAAMAAYAFARIDFPGSRALFMLFLATMMVPRQVTIIPLYLLMARIGWIDNLLAIIVPPALLNAFAVFMIRQFVRAIPIELEEAAILDGASRWTIFRTIVLPLLRPGLAALAILTFLDSWNNFFTPLIFLNSPQNFTVPLLVNQFRGQFSIDYAHLMAGSAIAIIPVLVVYIIGQRSIIESVATSGLSGR
ncbi:MAG: carbohydrate ABC transporter permease [Thermomicrobiales bacterium]